MIYDKSLYNQLNDIGDMLRKISILGESRLQMINDFIEKVSVSPNNTDLITDNIAIFDADVSNNLSEVNKVINSLKLSD